jgi:hypothetical protein
MKNHQKKKRRGQESKTKKVDSDSKPYHLDEELKVNLRESMASTLTLKALVTQGIRPIESSPTAKCDNTASFNGSNGHMAGFHPACKSDIAEDMASNED